MNREIFSPNSHSISHIPHRFFQDPNTTQKNYHIIISQKAKVKPLGKKKKKERKVIKQTWVTIRVCEVCSREKGSEDGDGERGWWV